MRVEKFSLFFPPTLFSKKRGETEYAIGAIPAGGYVKITGMNPDEDLPDEVRTRAYYSQPVWKRIVVIAAGPAMNLILAFVLMFVFFALIGPETGTSKVGVMETAYPAAKVLKSGDRVVAVDGKARRARRLREADRHARVPGRPPDGGMQGGRSPWSITVVRDGRERTFEITPIYDPAAPNSDGEDPGRTRLGFSYQAGPRETLPFGESLDVTAEQLLVTSRRPRSAFPRACSTRSSARRSRASSARTRPRARRSSTTSPRWWASSRSSRSRWRS